MGDDTLIFRTMTAQRMDNQKWDAALVISGLATQTEAKEAAQKIQRLLEEHMDVVGHTSQ